jgi:ribosome maturation factor RimP
VEAELPGRYRLEVSSAGLDRPLEYAWQYQKNIGRLIKITFDDDNGIRKTELFRLRDVSDNAVLVGPKSEQKKKVVEPLTIPLTRITKATIEPEF